MLDQCLDGGAALRRHQVANGMPAKIVDLGIVKVMLFDFWAQPGDIFMEYGENLVRRAVEIKLQLAVLVHRAGGADRRNALAVLAQALGPKLLLPAGKLPKLVGVGHQHSDVGAQFRLRMAVQGHRGHRRMKENIIRALCTLSIVQQAGRAFPYAPGIKPGQHGRQQGNVGECRKAPANVGRVIEDAAAKRFRHAPQRPVAGFGNHRKPRRQVSLAMRFLPMPVAGQELRHGLRRAA